MIGKIMEFGTENLRRLKKVLVHDPVEALPLINQGNYEYYLFNQVPKVDQYLREQEMYFDLLKSYGIEVIFVRDYVNKTKDLIFKLPNLAYTHDIATITDKGAILSEMCPGPRSGEEQVIKEALSNLGVPIFQEFKSSEQFEGCLIFSPGTLIIAETERHNRASIESFLPRALGKFEEVILIEVPKARRFMHADMLFHRLSEDSALYFPPAVKKTFLITAERRQEIDFKAYLNSKNIELIGISDEEQLNWGCSFVPLEPKVILHYDISLKKGTRKKLRQRGVELIEFHPDALLAGGGSLRCITLSVLRN